MVLLVAAGLLAATLLGVANAADPQRPIPEAGFLEPVPAAPCDPEQQFDVPNYYGNKCKRLRFVFGPITVKPGQNDLMIQPTIIEQPRYDGYITRFEPNLIDATGMAPPVETLHLHHGTWLNLPPGDEYGAGPFMASGEEKTIAYWPQGFGMKVLANDVWGFLYMVHNATASPTEVWITYDVDFVKAADAEAIQPDTGRPLITNTKNIWLDVGGGSFHPETETYPFNPVYNTQKGYGQDGACSFPEENCASFNSLGNVSAQQGKDVSQAVAGKDWRIPQGFLGPSGVGTLVVMGGHLHPGGLLDRVSLVRDGVEKDIHISDAVYWNEDDGTKVGGKPTSWDFSMTGVSKDIGWNILVKEGDIIRLNAVYETDVASWYENMGIVMSWVAPGDTSGVDVFAPGVTFNKTATGADGNGYPVTAKYPNGHVAPDCVPSATNVCTRGQITHGQMQENANHGSCDINNTCQGLTDKVGPLVERIDMAAFTYGVADFGVINANGIPQVKKNTPLLFTNLDTFDYMWHTATRCKEPCTGPTTVDFPIANGGTGIPGDVMDFDSSELGYGLYPAQRMDWTLVPDREGTFTFFCRIHPSMRGAFKVVE
jgi:hypothetical protein